MAEAASTLNVEHMANRSSARCPTVAPLPVSSAYAPIRPPKLASSAASAACAGWLDGGPDGGTDGGVAGLSEPAQEETAASPRPPRPPASSALREVRGVNARSR